MTVALLAAAFVTRTISVYGYPGDNSKRTSGMICAVPYKRVKGRVVMEFSRGSTLRLTNGTRRVLVRVADVCNGRYWGKRIDLPAEAYRALGGPKPWGLIKNVRVEVVK